jgi:hypothetical protein
MTKEAYIHIPLADNDGQMFPASMQYDFESQLVDLFGGCSVSDVRGVWKDPKSGRIYRDNCLRYAIAHDWDGFAAGKLRRLAAKAAQVFSQECIYVALPSTGVEFIEPIEHIKAA